MRNKMTLLGILLIALSVNSFAQSSATANASVTLVTPISIAKDFDMNFGEIAASGTAGTVILDYSDGVTKTGGVKLLSSAAVKTAQFTVSGEGTSTFSISFPSTITLTSASNDQLTVDGISCDAGTTSALDAGSKVIKVKGTLQVPA